VAAVTVDMGRRPTLKQIAAVAGVSAPTLSKVLNGHSDVAPGTRDRALRALREHNYEPRGARAIPSGGLHIELAFDAFRNPINLQILAGVVEAASLTGAHVAVGYAGRQPDTAWINDLIQTGRSGLILVTSLLSRSQQRRLASAHLPVVLIDSVNTPDAAIPNVGATNFAGGMAATEHLLALGHTRIAMLRGPECLCDTARFHGYTAALAAAELTPDPGLLERGDFNFESAIPAALRLLDRPDRPTAIFASNDMQALGVVEAARRLRLSVPSELSVVGFDDSVQSATSAPRLTTVRQPFREMGESAFQILTSMIAGRTPSSQSYELATQLVIRDSTAAPATSTETSEKADR